MQLSFGRCSFNPRAALSGQVERSGRVSMSEMGERDARWTSIGAWLHGAKEL